MTIVFCTEHAVNHLKLIIPIKKTNYYDIIMNLNYTFPRLRKNHNIELDTVNATQKEKKKEFILWILLT